MAREIEEMRSYSEQGRETADAPDTASDESGASPATEVDPGSTHDSGEAADAAEQDISSVDSVSDGNGAQSDTATTPTAGEISWAEVKAAVEAEVDRILKAFEDKLAYDASKQLQVDRLHSELLEHRYNLAAKAARPLINAVIKLHDDIGKLTEALRGKPEVELTVERFFKHLCDLQEDVEIILDQNGVASFREVEINFDPRRQSAIKKVLTPDEKLVGTVAHKIRPGFEQGVEILAKERVATYSFHPTQDSAEEGATDMLDTQDKGI